MNEINKVLFIINKYSGSGFRKSLEGKIVSACEQLNTECIIEFTQEPGHAYELAKAAHERKVNKVFAVGGDGTVNETARGLVHGDIPLGILPKGSGNGLARHLEIPMNLKKALRLLNSQSTIAMDTFLINGQLSVNVSGIGFDAHVASSFGKNGRRGLINYARLTVSEFRKYPENNFEFVIDDQAGRRSAFLVAIANSSQFGNNARIAPLASVTDHQLDFCFVKKISAVRALDLAVKMFSNRIHESPYVELVRAKRAELRTTEPLAYHIDGEPKGFCDHFEIEIQPATLRIIVPSFD